MDASALPEPSCAARLAGALGAGCGAALLVRDLGRLACTSRELASCRLWDKVRLSGSSPEGARATLRFMDAAIIGGDQFARMTVLHVQFCEGLRDEHLQHLPHGLTELNLDCCQKLTDAYATQGSSLRLAEDPKQACSSRVRALPWTGVCAPPPTAAAPVCSGSRSTGTSRSGPISNPNPNPNPDPDPDPDPDPGRNPNPTHVQASRMVRPHGTRCMRRAERRLGLATAP